MASQNPKSEGGADFPFRPDPSDASHETGASSGNSPGRSTGGGSNGATPATSYAGVAETDGRPFMLAHEQPVAVALPSAELRKRANHALERSTGVMQQAWQGA